MSLELKNSTRRNFLKNLGLLATGAVVTTGVGGLINPQPASAAAPALPWPYANIDTAVVRKRAYDNYWIGGCMYASAKALLDTLYDTVGAPWDSIPASMFNYGKGGAFSWGTLCGALNGSLYVINLATGTAVDQLGPELIGWYTTNIFPSRLMDSYARFSNVKQTVAHSPLCHLSVGKWCDESEFTINSDQKKDRCAKLAADTAVKAVELMNAWKAGTFKGAYVASSEFASCLSCHNGAGSQLDNEQGLADCTECHDESHGESHDD